MSEHVEEPAHVNGDVGKNAIDRIWAIPILHQTATQLIRLLEKNAFSCWAMNTTEGLATRAYNLSKPGLDRLPLERANTYANKSLDYVQEKYPGVFEIDVDIIVKQARRPADAAVEVFQRRLSAAQQSLVGAQENLSSAVKSVPTTTEQLSGAVASWLHELNKLKDTATANVRDLPKAIQDIVHPLSKRLDQGVQDVAAEFGRTELPLTTRAANVLKYSRENATPVIQDTLVKLKELVLKKKEDVQADVHSSEGAGNGDTPTYAEVAGQDAIGPH